MFRLPPHTKYKLKDIDAGHHRVTYKGIPAIKCPFDYLLYQMLLWEVKPDLVIEIGTNKGGSALYLADLLELNGKGVVHTIDLPENNEDPLVQAHHRINVYKKGFANYMLPAPGQYPVVLVIEDGSHYYEDTLAALRQFSPLVTHNSYYIVEDGIVNKLGRAREYNGGPQRAIGEFLQQNNHFIIDRKWCDFFGQDATFNINGYLKKIG
jgi:cephalosporin hydroxylase